MMRFSFRTLLLSALCFCAFSSKAQDAEPPANSKTDALYYDAVKAHILGNDKESETLLLQVIKQKPEEAAPYYDLSRITFAQNRSEKATEYIKKAIELDGKNKWYREQYGNILALSNKFDEAANQFAQLAKTEKYNEEYLMKAAALYQRSGKYKEALSVLDELDKKEHQDNEEVLLQKQQVYLKMNDLEGAAAVIHQLMDRNPKEARWHTLLAELYTNNKQPEKAKEVYQEMKKKFPEDPTVQLALSAEALKKGDTAGYRTYVRKAVINKSLDPDIQWALLRQHLPDIVTDSFQRHEALGLMEQIVSQHPEDASVASYYGDLLSLDNQQDRASAQYKKSVTLDPSKYSHWRQLLYSYTDRKDADTLIRYSEKAARLFPAQGEVHYLNGVAHYNKREYSAAVKAINRAIDLQPEDNADLLSSMYSSLGDAFNSLKEYVQSDSAFEHALKLNKDNASLLNNYAYYLSERKVRLEDAARMSKRSLELRPGEGTFLDTYGWILYQQGKYEEAHTYIRKAIESAGDATDATLYEHLGAIEYKLGASEKAVDAWRKAKAKGSDNAMLDKMITERKLYE